MDIYDRIDAILQEKHMSRRQLAQNAGLNNSSLAAAFARRSRMPPDNLEKIAKALETSPVDLDPRYKTIAQLIHRAEKESEYYAEQSARFAIIEGYVREFKNDGFFAKLKDTPKVNDLYDISAAAFALNAEGRARAIQYLFDLNRIPEYFDFGSAMITDMIIPYYTEEVTPCPEDAPQTAAEHSPDSAQMDAGKSNTVPAVTPEPES